MPNTRHMQHLSPKTPFLVRVADLVVIALALGMAHFLYPIGTVTALAIAGLSAAVLYSLAAELTGAAMDQRMRPFAEEVRAVFLAWLLTLGALLGLSWAIKLTATYSRVETGLWACFGVMLLAAERWSLRRLLRMYQRNGHARRAVLVGGGDLAAQWIETSRAFPELGVTVEAVFDDDPDKQGEACAGVPVAGTCDLAVEYVNARCVPLVFFALPLRAEQRLREIMTQFADSPANLYFIPDIFTYHLMNLNTFQVGGTPVIALSTAVASAHHNLVKRAEDLLLGCLALCAAAPLMLLIAAGILVSSPGPVFFRQWRYGIDGTKIKIWKFRTMDVCEDGHDCVQASREDGRVTRFGRLLRQTSLDELPQLFNVLQGSMSLVGPRPHPIALDEYYRGKLPRYMWRLKIRPGMTGWAQVHGWRGETDTLDKMRQRMEHDLYYIEHWSPWLDIRILWLTVRRGFVHANAY